MTLVVTNVERWFDGQRVHQVGTILASANYATGGETVNFAQSEIKSNRVPDWVEIHGKAGYVYGYDPGTTLANGKMLVFEAGADGAALDEHANGAFAAAVIADVIRYHAIFKSR